MQGMQTDDFVVFFLGLSVLLGSAHALGEVARRLEQPAVIGEIFAGLLLGPACLGWFAPAFQAWLFPTGTPAAIALGAVVALAVSLLLLVAGMEVDLSAVCRQGRASVLIALAGLLVPLLIGGCLAYVSPSWWGMPETGKPPFFAVFFGTALAVSALPVIAKIFLDLDLFRTDFGMLVLVAATLNNLMAWLLFSVVLGGRSGSNSVGYIVVLTVGYVVFMLTVGRWMIDRALPWVQAHFAWPSGVLGFILVLGLAGAAITEAIGIHAIFGAFLVGIAIGDSAHLREDTRQIVQRFVEGILAPIFVAAIGLQVNFITNFYPSLVFRVLALGIVVKVIGCAAAARFAGIRRAEAQAVGWAMSARGELGIVLGLLAWESGVIRERLFVALVTLAIVTSAAAGPMLKRLLKRERSWTLGPLLEARSCLLNLDVPNVSSAIRELSAAACLRCGLNAEEVAHAVLEREDMMSTALGDGVAVPHARLAGLKAPLVVAGIVEQGIDFDAPDGDPVRLIFLVLTPLEDNGAQVQILSSIARVFRNPQVRRETLAAQTATAFIAALRVGDVRQKKEALAA
jgi:Kef-type K+ transport system membrane component KefB/mannitol/fructose-specific phosphotransferase system IIA component (Ntr-type)